MTLGFLILAKLLLYGLATFRLAILISQDTGPWRLLSKFRSWLKREEKHNPALKKADAAKGVSCLRCSSLQLAIAVSAYAHFRSRLLPWISTTADVIIWALALSALAIIFVRAFPEKG